MVVLVEKDQLNGEGVLLKDKKATAMLVTGPLKTVATNSAAFDGEGFQKKATTTLATSAFSDGDFKGFQETISTRDNIDTEGHHQHRRASTTKDIDHEGHRLRLRRTSTREADDERIHRHLEEQRNN